MDWMTDFGEMEPLPPEQFPGLVGELADLLVMDDKPDEAEREFVLSLLGSRGVSARIGRTLRLPSS